MFTVPTDNQTTNIFKVKFTGSGIAIMALLILALIALAERILYDLTRTLVSGSLNYFDNLNVITIHAFAIIAFLVLSIIVNFWVGSRKQKYAVVLVPYFITSIFLAMQLALQVSVYFINHHTVFQFYLVMSLLVLISTWAIYYIQKKYNPTEVIGEEHTKNIFGALTLFALSMLIVGGGFWMYHTTHPKTIGYNDFPIPTNSYNNQNSYQYPPVTQRQMSPSDPNENATTPPGYIGADLTTPRVGFWGGKVNQHWSLENKRWETDPNPDSNMAGAGVDKLSYCRIFYPQTKSVVAYRPEIITTWHDGGNTGNYTTTIVTDKCVQ